MPLDTIRVLMGVERSFLDAAFAAIDARYGSLEVYASEGMRLTADDIAALRSRLLEDAV